jgi:hypothetical protein
MSTLFCFINATAEPLTKVNKALALGVEAIAPPLAYTVVNDAPKFVVTLTVPLQTNTNFPSYDIV